MQRKCALSEKVACEKFEIDLTHFTYNVLKFSTYAYTVKRIHTHTHTKHHIFNVQQKSSHFFMFIFTSSNTQTEPERRKNNNKKQTIRKPFKGGDFDWCFSMYFSQNSMLIAVISISRLIDRYKRSFHDTKSNRDIDSSAIDTKPKKKKQKNKQTNFSFVTL